jgi:valyl-tRNA synthetase
MMPFVTEEIFRALPRAEDDTAPMLIVAAWPDVAALAAFADPDAEASMSLMQEVVTSVRAVRARFRVPPSAKVDLVVKAQPSDALLIEAEVAYLRELAGVATFEVGPEAIRPAHSAVDVVRGMELYVPLEGLVDLPAERARIAKELDRARGDHEKLTKKLGNEGFLAKAAPEVIEKDRARAADLADEVGKLTAQLSELAE